jgi:hypothetical protein
MQLGDQDTGSAQGLNEMRKQFIEEDDCAKYMWFADGYRQLGTLTFKAGEATKTTAT